MSFFAGLTELLGFLLLLIASIGVVAPSLFQDKKTGKIPKRSELLLGGTIASIAFFIASALLTPTSEPQKQSQNNNGAQQAAPELTAKRDEVSKPTPTNSKETLGISPEEFRQSFNKIISEIDANYKVAEFDIEQGEVNNAFKRTLSNSIGIVGSVNKSDGSLRELIIIIGRGESHADNIKSIAIILSATQALNSSVEKGMNSEIVLDMVKVAMANVKTGKPSSAKSENSNIPRQQAILLA